MIKKIDNDSITLEMDFDEYAVVRGFAGIGELMDYYGVHNEREAVVKNAEEVSEYVDSN